jgi:hypothetical protein
VLYVHAVRPSAICAAQVDRQVQPVLACPSGDAWWTATRTTATLSGKQPITSRMLGVDLDGTRRIEPTHVGWVVGPDRSRRIVAAAACANPSRAFPDLSGVRSVWALVSVRCCRRTSSRIAAPFPWVVKASMRGAGWSGEGPAGVLPIPESWYFRVGRPSLECSHARRRQAAGQGQARPAGRRGLDLVSFWRTSTEVLAGPASC